MREKSGHMILIPILEHNVFSLFFFWPHWAGWMVITCFDEPCTDVYTHTLNPSYDDKFDAYPSWKLSVLESVSLVTACENCFWIDIEYLKWIQAVNRPVYLNLLLLLIFFFFLLGRECAHLLAKRASTSADDASTSADWEGRLDESNGTLKGWEDPVMIYLQLGSVWIGVLIAVVTGDRGWRWWWWWVYTNLRLTGERQTNSKGPLHHCHDDNDGGDRVLCGDRLSSRSAWWATMETGTRSEDGQLRWGWWWEPSGEELDQSSRGRNQPIDTYTLKWTKARRRLLDQHGWDECGGC